jgi:hypothetical protein
MQQESSIGAAIRASRPSAIHRIIFGSSDGTVSRSDYRRVDKLLSQCGAFVSGSPSSKQRKGMEALFEAQLPGRRVMVIDERVRRGWWLCRLSVAAAWSAA